MVDGGGAEQNARSRSHRLGFIDEKWPEVVFINDYAVFMGYLSMAVTGTGILVLTWSTVVLLGGFVTMLAKEDFWSLTVITLVQTRIFDVFLNGNLSYFGYSLKRLWRAALSIALPRTPFRKWSARQLIRVVVFTIVLCPLFALYMFGLFVSPLISLWRLVQKDYGDAGGDSSKANLKPALVVLYSLALFQGMLFCYRAISSLEEQWLLKQVAEAYRLKDDDQARESLSDYLRDIRVGCEKDPSFARGRNLVTYAAELMQSNSPDNYISGVRILDTLIGTPESEECPSKRSMTGSRSGSGSSGSGDPGASMVESQRMLINNMVGSSSSGAMEKFVHMLDYRSGEISMRAMKIVAYFASEIRLNKVPYGVQCISSFLDDPEARKKKDTSIAILLKLTSDKENLRLMSETSGLALKVIKLLAELDSDADDQLHDSDHKKWCSSIALPGMKVIKRFVSATTGPNNNMKLPREILENNDAISTLENMLDCKSCKEEEELQVSVMKVLTNIAHMDTTSLGVGDEVRQRLILSFIGMFLDGSDDDKEYLKELAGESLAQLSLGSEKSATFILGASNGDFVDSLTKLLLDVNSKKCIRKSAADILNHLCSHCYTTNDGKHRFDKLKRAMVQDIPKVLREVLRSAVKPPSSTAGLCRRCFPASQQCFSLTFSQPVSSTFLSQSASPATTSQPNGLVHTPYDDDVVEVQEALISLCATVHGRMISVDPDLARQFDDIIAAEISRDMAKEPAMLFAALVKEAAALVKEAAQVVAVVANRRRYLATVPPPTMFTDENPNACCIS